MKRAFSLILAVMFIVGIAGSSLAGEIAYSRGSDARIKMVTYTASSTAQDTSGTIVNGTNRILGFSVTGSSATVGGLYDTTSTINVGAGTGLVTEAACAAGTISTIMFPTPYSNWTNTLYVLVATSGGAVTIYYE